MLGTFSRHLYLELFRVDRKRIVITGLSAITPLGTDLESSWEALLAGKSGIGRITHFDSTEFPTHIAGEVKDFKPEEFIPAKQCRKMDRFCQLAVCAGMQLVADSGLKIDESNAQRVGVVLGVGLGGLKTIEDFHEKLRTSGPNRVSPFYIPHAHFQYGSRSGGHIHRRQGHQRGVHQRLRLGPARHRQRL